MKLDYTKLAYHVMGGLADLALWVLVVSSIGELSAHADAFGATTAVLSGAFAGGAFYRHRHPVSRNGHE